jgi:uncharacterized protein YbjT (DUF2867 family)
MLVASKANTKEPHMFVITGVTGHTGSVVASTLLAAGKPVRVVVRDAAKGAPWKAKGAEVAIAELSDRAAFARALAGATGAYILQPPFAWNATGIPAERAALVEAIAGAVGDAKPKHVVLLSSVGADQASGTGPVQYLHHLEGKLKTSGVPSTFLRAGFFMDNWATMFKGAVDAGTLYYGFAPDVAVPQVATQDIGKLAAKLLVEGAPTGTRVVQLSGPADLTLGETAAAFSKVAGKPIGAVSVPLEAMIGSLTGMGASRDVAEIYAEMTGAINERRMKFEAGEIVRGSTALETKLREYA